ncbi:MAG: hypothetical protein M3Q74_06065 [Pseudomonadota bacterium]|nr:hypothetical protein [Pseudomonadota bacterium]
MDDPFVEAVERAGDEGLPESARAPIGADEVTGFLVAAGDVVARWRGDHWRIDPSECDVAAPAIARQLAKPDGGWLAEWMERHGDTMLITVGLGLIVAPRVGTELAIRRERRRAILDAAPAYGSEYGYGPDYGATPAGDDQAASSAGYGVPVPGYDQRDVRPVDPRSLATAFGEGG